MAPALDDILAGIDLTERQRQVAALLARDYSQADVAAELGISRPRVSQIVKEIRERYRAQDD